MGVLRTGVVHQVDTDALSMLTRGDNIRLPAFGGETLSARVNLVQVGADGVRRIAGELVGDVRGSVSLAVSGREVSGRILIPAAGIALELRLAGRGETILLELPLSDTICFTLPPAPEGPMSAAGEFPLLAPPILSSRPGATAVLYLDFDGATVTDPDWNSGNTIVAAPSNLSAPQIAEVWSRVKEDYWPFQIDVTTDAARYAAAPVGSRMRCIVTPTSQWFGTAGGVAYRNSFNQAGTLAFNVDVPCWVFNSSVTGIAEAIAHELGHTLGLRHDGDLNRPSGSSAREYYSGHGSGAMSWGPIMGVSYTRSIVQWSKGEYPGANNTEDDIGTIVSATNGFGYIADEAGGTRTTAAALGFVGGTIAQSGVITSAADIDFYSFSIGAATLVTLAVNPASVSPNLDIGLELQDAVGTVLATANSDDALSAGLSFTLAAGTYYVKLYGVGRGNVLGDGYSSYGSIGHYALAGSFGAGVPPVITAPPLDRSILVNSSTTFSVGVSGSAPLSFRWRKDGVDLSDGGGISGAGTSALVISNAQLSDAGAYSVRVSNPAGTITSAAASLIVTVPAPPVITLQPSISGGGFGESVVLSVNATGEGTLNYQWYRNGAAITGATSTILFINNLGLAELGDYHVVVSNGGEPVMSARLAVPYRVGVHLTPDSFWIDAREESGVVYFLCKNPARVLRYDLATEAWLPAIALTWSPNVLGVAADAVYLAAEGVIRRYDRNLGNETMFLTLAEPVRGMEVTDSHLVVVTPNLGLSSYFRVATYSRASAQKVDDTNARWLGQGFSFSSEARRLYGRTTGVSPGDVYAVPIGNDGTVGAAIEGPYHHSYDEGSRTMVTGNGAFVTDDAGILYRASDLTYSGSFGGRIQDVMDGFGGETLVVQGATLARFDEKFRRTAAAQLSRYPFRAWRRGTKVFGFAHPATAGGTPTVEKVELAQLRAPVPATPRHAMGRRVTPQHMVLDETGVLYVYSPLERTIHRWSTAERRYLTPIPLLDKSSRLAYSQQNRELYTDDGANLVRRVPLDAFSLSEVPFASAAEALTGLTTAGRFVFLTDGSRQQAHYIFTATGERVSIFGAGHASREFTWSAATNRMYFFRDNTDPNDLLYENIDASGVITTGRDSPYNSEAGITLPIRVSPDGAAVLLGSGRVYDGSTLTQLASLANPLLDAAWSSGSVHTARSGGAGTEIQTWHASTYVLQRSMSFPGSPLRLFALGTDRLLLVTQVNDYLVYRVLAAASLAVLHENNTNVAPAIVPATLLVRPTNQVVVPGGTAVFSALGYGDGPITYKWTKDMPLIPPGPYAVLSDGGTISGATTSSLVIEDVKAADLGTYTVTVNNANGQATSLNARLDFASPPVIATSPSPTTTPEWGTAILSVVVTGTGPFSYQWRRNGLVVLDDVNVSGATTASLTMTNVGAANAGNYTVTVANQLGSATSGGAALSVTLTPPKIVTQPQGFTGIAGKGYSLSVAATGSAPLSYQWRRDGVSLAGATTASFGMSPLLSMHAGVYSVVVSNPGHSVTSIDAPVFVLAAPEISMQPQAQAVEAGSSVTFTVQATGTAPLTYRWQKNGEPLSDGGRISGAMTETLTITGVQASDAGSYAVVVSNSTGTRSSAFASLTIGPAIVSQPTGRHVVPAGGAATFAVSAPSATSFQWRRNGQPIAGASAASFTLPTARWSDNGYYQVAASNSSGTRLSAPFFVNVTAAPTVIRAWGANQSGETTLPANLTSVAAVAGGGSHGLALRADGSVAAWGRAIEGQLSVPAGLDSVVAVEAGGFHSVALRADGTVAVWGYSNHAYMAPPAGLGSVVAVAAGPDHVAALKSDGTVVAWGIGLYGETAVPAELDDVVSIASFGFHTLALRGSGTVAAWGRSSEGQIAVPVGLSGVVAVAGGYYHSLALRSDGTVVAWGGNSDGQATVPAGLANVVAIAAGYYHSLALRSDGAVVAWGRNTSEQVAVPAGLSGVAAIAGGGFFSLGLQTAPRLTAQPLAQTVTLGSNTSFTVAAPSSGAVTFQWRKNGSPLNGKTAAVLELNNVQSGDTGEYDVMVTNGTGSTLSATATLMVASPVPHAMHAVAAGGYMPGHPVTISNVLSHPGGFDSIEWEVLLPAGWSFASSMGTVGIAGHAVGSTSLLEWTWTNVPASPFVFSYTLNVPAGQAGEQEIVSRVVLKPAGESIAILAQPDPLVVPRVMYHSADTDQDLRISLTELTRVIELYNTRYGSMRTGAYAVAAEASEDGFVTAPAREPAAWAVLTRHHSADTQGATIGSLRDGRLDLFELTRVIQLYNVRAGTTRTGAYRVQSGTEDGFAPGL